MIVEPFASASRAPLLDRLLAGDPAIASRLGGAPDIDGVAAAVARLEAGSRGDRADLVSSLAAAHDRLDAPSSSRENVEALGDASTWAVVTGQQPGMLGGPLYTVWKAATAIQLARRLTSSGIGRFVPVFWIASDDHDLAEIEGCQLLNADGDVRRFRIPLSPPSTPSAFVSVPDDAAPVVASFFDEVPDGPHKAAVAELAAPRPGERWPTWFSRILLAQFPDDGLVLFEPHENASLVAPWLERERARLDHVPTLLRRGAAAMVELGLGPPLPIDRPSSLFLYDGDARRRVGPDTDVDAAIARHGEAALSGDAGLRAVVQSLVLPTAVAIGGPGELAYWLQLPEAFHGLDASQPLFWPRLSATIVESRIRRAIAALELDDGALLRDHPEDEPDDDAVDPAWARSADEARLAISRFTALFEEEGGGGLPKKLRDLEQRSATSIDRILRQATEQRRERLGTSQRRRRLVSSAGMPGGKPQERVLNGLPFLARAGVDFFSRAAAAIDPLRHEHWRIEVEPPT